MVNLIFSIFYLLVLISIAIIDKKEHKIPKTILLVGFVVEAIQMIYLYANNEIHLIEYLIYLVIFILLVIIDTIVIRKKGESIVCTSNINALYVYGNIYRQIYFCSYSDIYFINHWIISFNRKNIYNKKKKNG